MKKKAPLSLDKEEIFQYIDDTAKFAKEHPEVELMPLVTAYDLCREEDSRDNEEDSPSIEDMYQHVLSCEFCHLFLQDDLHRKNNGLQRINIMQITHDRREGDA